MTNEEVQAEVDWYLHHPDDADTRSAQQKYCDRIADAEAQRQNWKRVRIEGGWEYIRIDAPHGQDREGAFLPIVGAILVAGVIVGAVVGVLVTLWQHFIPVTH